MLEHRILGGSGSSISGSCPCLGSELIAAARACLWSSFRRCSAFCGHTGKESPLLALPETKVSCLSGSSSLFPGLPPGELWCTSPLQAVFTQPTPVLSLGSNLQSPASAPSPHLPWWVIRQASQVGECWSALILCAGIPPLCLLQLCCFTLLHGSEVSPRPTPHLRQWRGFLVCGNVSSFTAPSQRCRSHPYYFVSVFSVFFCSTQVHGDFLAFWEV